MARCSAASGFDGTTSGRSRSTRSALLAGSRGARVGRRQAAVTAGLPGMTTPLRQASPGSAVRPIQRGGRPMTPDLRTRLGNVELPNPVLTASGCASSGRELAQFVDVSKIGAIVTKSVMRAPRAGRPTPRMAETASGMLNSIGLQGPGIDAFLARDLPWLLQHDARPIVSIAGSTLGEFAELARRVGNTPGVAAIEVNISCPNVENRGLVFACDPVQA